MATVKGSNIEMMPLGLGRQTIWHLQKMKDEGKKITMVGTAYMDPIFTMLCEKSGVNLVRYASPGETVEQRAANVPWWTRALRKMAPNICLNAVLQTQQCASKEKALENAAIAVADGADSVMVMGIQNEILKYLADNYIAVFGHVGVLSGWQTGRFGGYRRVGKTAESALDVFRMAYEYQENGMAGMTIEMTPREVTNLVAKKLRVPVIEVAGGGAADGSEMVIFDLLGLLPPEAMAKHSKAYASLLEVCMKGFSGFVEEVNSEAYPAEEHGWGMDPEEFEKFANEVEKKYPDVK
ncbi:3-methyl-2-oxobutanoate hydroxymethyltransferase [Clostridia bacterium]|nr:3-methyl-2-oxobutanoate hydroxymethyltransferase [Clostridia bacterium]